MYLTTLLTDCNGFCLFDPTKLRQVLAREPVEGENLFALFMRDEVGDVVLRSGAVVPIYPITDGGYDICIRDAESVVPSDRLPALVTTGVYPLHVLSRLILADLAVLQEWSPELAWNEVPLAPGFYSVVISAHDGEPPGFDVVLEGANELPELTATFETDLDIVVTRKLKHPDSGS